MDQIEMMKTKATAIILGLGLAVGWGLAGALLVSNWPGLGDASLRGDCRGVPRSLIVPVTTSF